MQTRYCNNINATVDAKRDLVEEIRVFDDTNEFRCLCKNIAGILQH